MDNWSVLTLRDAGVELIDCVHKTPAAQEDGFPYVGIPQMKDGWIDFDSARKISRQDFLGWTRKAKPQQHDVVLSRRTNPGVTTVDRTGTDFALGQNLVLLRSNGQKIDPPFLKWLVRTPAWWGQIDKFINVGAVFNSLKCADVPNFELPVPPIDTQQRISGLLDAIDTRIDLNRRMNETLEALVRVIFKDWFIDFGPTRAKAEGRAPYLAPELWDPFPDALDEQDKPVGWEEEPVYAQAHWVNGAAYKNMHFTNTPDALPVIKIAELKTGVTKNTKSTNTALGDKYRIMDGELLFSWSGNPDTSIDAFIWVGGSAWLNQHIFAVRENGKRPQPFLYAMLKWLKPEFAEIARNKQTTGLGHVTQQDLKRLLVHIGSTEVMAAFDELMKPIYDRILGNLIEMRVLAQTRDLLVPKLMSGEIHLRDTEAAVKAVA